MRELISLVVAIPAACIAIPLLGGPAIFGGSGANYVPTTAAPPLPAPVAQSDGQMPTIDAWDSEQISNAATIITVGNTKAVPPWGWVVAVATAIQESSLRDLPGGDRDSIGLFQQRPSQGVGHTEQLTEPALAVERSAYPDAYATTCPCRTHPSPNTSSPCDHRYRRPTAWCPGTGRIATRAGVAGPARWDRECRDEKPYGERYRLCGKNRPVLRDSESHCLV